MKIKLSYECLECGSIYTIDINAWFRKVELPIYEEHIEVCNTCGAKNNIVFEWYVSEEK